MKTTEIQREIFLLQDKKYRDFQAKLIPTVDPETIIGTRTPALRSYAKELIKKGEEAEFLKELTHRYFDENQLHAFILSAITDYDRCMAEVARFLPFINKNTVALLSTLVRYHNTQLSDDIPVFWRLLLAEIL